MSTVTSVSRQVTGAPWAAAIVGIIFSALFTVSLVLVRLAVPADPTDPGTWLTVPANRQWVHLALNLVPFAGIAVLWFMGVLRNRIGALEDQFYATAFLGSGLLFVAMLFASAAVASGMLTAASNAASAPALTEAYAVGRGTTHALLNIFTIRMAAVFMFVTSAIELRTAIVPRWLAFVGYALGLVLLLIITDFAWIALLFPFWVLLVSAYILVADYRQRQQGAAK
jgi:hypothetical protein